MRWSLVPTFQLLMIMLAIFSCPANLRPTAIARKGSPCFSLIACASRQGVLISVAGSCAPGVSKHKVETQMEVPVHIDYTLEEGCKDTGDL